MGQAFQFTICGLSELDLHSGAKVSHVLSILDPEWPVPEVFGTYGEHEKLELRFDDIIVDKPGLTPPRLSDVEQVLAFGRDLNLQPAGEGYLLVHCHAGISRSSACLALLMAQAEPDRAAPDIFVEILAVRPKIWPNLRIIEMGDALLGRNGSLVAAVADIYRHQIGKFPGIAAEFRATGRAREVDAALA